MVLTWKESTGNDLVSRPLTCYSSEYNAAEDSRPQIAISEIVDKAVELMPLNINDQSMYLMFEWKQADAELSVVVTDETKSCDAEHVIRCVLSGLPSGEKSIESIRYWIRDYLTTCSGFMRYSLIAVFHSESRSRVDLL